MTTAAVQLVRLRQIVGSTIADRAGDPLGRVDDVIVRLTDGMYPPVIGVQGRVSGRQVFIPMAQIADLGPGTVQLTGQTLNLGRFERRQGEVLLKHDILVHKLIDIEAGRLVGATDIVLAHSDGTWRVVGIDTGPQGLVARLFKRASDRPIEPETVVDWSAIEPFVGHVPTARLRLPLRSLKRLHPAQIADLVENASHEEGEEIITAVHGDPELEADVFEELDAEHQVEFLRTRSDTEAAEVLAEMAPDDAADLIAELDQARRASILARLPAEQQSKVRALLAYNPSTAGGLMTPDLIAVDQDKTVGEVLEQVREADVSTQTVYLVDSENRLVGSISLDALLRAPIDRPTRESVEPNPARITVDADFTDVALLMADYNLTVAPVVNDRDELVGVISVDDVLEALIPEEWRRRVEASTG